MSHLSKQAPLQEYSLSIYTKNKEFNRTTSWEPVLPDKSLEYYAMVIIEMEYRIKKDKRIETVKWFIPAPQKWSISEFKNGLNLKYACGSENEHIR